MDQAFFPTNSDFDHSTDFFSYNPGLVLDDLSPPPLDPGADEGDEDMENEEDEADLGAISSLNNFGTLSSSANASSDSQQASQVAFADELPLSLNKSLFGDSLPMTDLDFDLQASIYQTFSSEFELDKILNSSNTAATSDSANANNNTNNIPATTTTSELIQDFTSNLPQPATALDSSSTIDNQVMAYKTQLSLEQDNILPFIPNTAASSQLVLPEPDFTFSTTASENSSPLSSTSSTTNTTPHPPASAKAKPNNSINSSSSTPSSQSISSVSTQSVPRPSVLSMQSRTAAAAVAAATRTPLSTKADPVRTDEERKRRNRVYAKRSRDLKNQKYRESITKNKDLERRVDMVAKENQELKLENQRLEFLLKEMRQKLVLHGISDKDDLSQFHMCSHSHLKKEDY